jgi:hypothetical protein
VGLAGERGGGIDLGTAAVGEDESACRAAAAFGDALWIG